MEDDDASLSLSLISEIARSPKHKQNQRSKSPERSSKRESSKEDDGASLSLSLISEIAHSPKHSLDQRSKSPERPSKISRTEELSDNKELSIIQFIPQTTLDQRSKSPERPSKISSRTEELSDDKELSIVEFIPQTMSQNPRIQRYLIAIEYIGTQFSGSQQQLNCRTVVGVLEEAFHKFVGQPVSIFCSSRTDAGVHALSNVCHVDVERISKRKPGEVLPPHEPAVVRRAVNHFLQKNEGDIMLIDVRCVPADFHARYKARERRYIYRLLSGPEPLSTFEKDRGWHVPEELDLLSMQKVCKVLVGCHDFSSFRAAGCQAKSPIRTLDELHVSEVVFAPYFPSIMERERTNFIGEDHLACSSTSQTVLPASSSISRHDGGGSSNGGTNQGFGIRRNHRCYVVTARARAFLYHQVRLLVGVLKSVGTGDLTISDVERILNAKTVTAASPMAPARGLYLENVKYDLP